MTGIGAFVTRDQHRIWLQECAGAEPAIVLMHGFPDNLHLYDRLVPYLSPPRRVVAFDFLGWGGSDKPSAHAYTSRNLTLDLDAVIEQRGFGQVVLVAHDASGPPAIDWALDHPDRVAALVLLNTYYSEMPDAQETGGDLALLDAARKRCRTSGLGAVRSLALSPHVLVAGRAILPRRWGQERVSATTLSAVRGDSQRTPGILRPERRPAFNGSGSLEKALGTEKLQATRADHLR